jgi:hypothetical protein
MWPFIDGRMVEEWWVSGTVNALTRLLAYCAKGAYAGHSASTDAAALRGKRRAPRDETHFDS